MGSEEDRIEKYVPGTYSFGEAAAESYRRLDAELKGKEGELFLVTLQERKRSVFLGCFGGREPSEADFHLETVRYMGLLAGENLYIDTEKKGCSGIPVRAYICLDDPKLKKTVGDYCFLFKSRYGLESRNKPIYGGKDTGVALEIFIGDAAVFSFIMQKPKGRDVLKRASNLLGKKLPESSRKKWARTRRGETCCE